MTKLLRYVALGAISNQVADAFTRPLGGAENDASRGDFLDVLREVAREQSGLNLRGPVGPIAVGRCADRDSSNQCCAGSSWDCQAPGSTCSCDQMCVKFGDCCPDYQDVCGNAFDDACQRKGKVSGPADDDDDDQSATSNNLASQPMFDDHGALLPVLVGVGNGRANGDPHYHTFDGDTIHFQGGCTYQLTGLCHSAVGATVDGVNLQNFRVYGKNYQKYKTSKKNGLQKAMAWIQDVIVEIPLDDSMIHVFMGSKLDEIKVHYVFNSGNYHTQVVDPKQLPLQIYNSHGVAVARLYKRNDYLRLQLGSDGLTVAYNGKAHFKVHLPCEYNNNVCGLLGNADNDPSNDNIMPNGDAAESHNQLGDSWMFNSFPEFMGINTAECDDDSLATAPEPQCPAIDLREAATVCKKIIDTNGPFAQCHHVISPASYFEDCVYDTCLFIMNDLDTSETKCDAFQDYASECRDKGIAIDWREDAQCTVDCPAGSSYWHDHPSTEETCEGFRQVASDEDESAEGCFCDSGYVRSGNHCIEVGKCFSHCTMDDGSELEIDTEHLAADCSRKCTCSANYADSTLPPVTNCVESSCDFNEHCVDHSAFGMCQAIQFNAQFGTLDTDFGGLGSVDFLGGDGDLACLTKEEPINFHVTGGAGGHGPSRASAIWLKPDACCGDLPFNTGEKGCCNGHTFALDSHHCHEGQIVEY